MQARILLAAAAIALPATPAMADSRADATRHLQLGAESEAPRGYVEMCVAHAEWCAPPAPPPTVAESAPIGANRGGSALPMILSFNFAVPWGVLEREGSMASLRAGPKAEWLAPIAALADAPRVVASGVAGAAREASVTRLAAQAEDTAVQRIKSVNRRVNGAVVQRLDTQVFGQGELWRRSGVGPGATGDCEDIAIEKRLQLVAEGFPADRLAFAVVYRRGVGLHTVLLARTDAGDVVLDNLTSAILSWDKARYSWISVQSMTEPGRWFAPAHNPTG